MQNRRVEQAPDCLGQGCANTAAGGYYTIYTCIVNAITGKDAHKP
jgi:hypothetical protein